MSSIQRILCPTDFSEGSRAALVYALNLGQQLHASVTLLHVTPIPTYIMPGGTYPPMADQSALMMESAQKQLNAWIKEYTNATTLNIDSALRKGNTYRQINEVAEAMDVNLVVMGTHGRSGLAHFILGSVAERVVRTSQRPVLTVPSRPAAERPDVEHANNAPL
ncbi:MAG: universal stress protein A [Polyangiales bacterium]|jgi:universal stress protein A